MRFGIHQVVALFATILISQGHLASAGSSSGPKRRSDEPKLYEVSAPTGDVAYFQVTPDGSTALFRDPAGTILAVENDHKYFPGYTIRFAQGTREMEVFSSLIFYKQNQPLPVIYVINREYIAGIDDGQTRGKELIDRARKEFQKSPEDFRSLLLSFYQFAEKSLPEMAAASASIEDLLNNGPGTLKPYEAHTRLIEDSQECAKIKAMMAP